MRGISYRFLKSMISKVGNSKTAGLFTSISKRLSNDFVSSCFVLFLCKIMSFVQKQYSASFLCAYICSDDIIQKKYESSFLCMIVILLYNTFAKSVTFVFDNVKKLCSGGYVDSILSFVKERGFLELYFVFGLYLSLMIMCPHEIWNNIYAVGAAVLFLLWVTVSYSRKESKFSVANVSFFCVTFVLFAVLSVFYAYATKDGARIVMFLISALVFCFVAKFSLDSEDKILIVVKLICLAVFATSVMGIVQRIMGVEVNPEFVDIASNSGMPGRIFSTFANPNSYAELLVLGIPLTLGLVYISNSNCEKIIWAIFLATDIVSIAMTYSRSCYVALVISIIVMTCIYNWKYLIPIGIIALVAIPLLPSTVIDRILTTGSMTDTSNSSRLFIWSGAWQVLKNYFLSGVGAGPVNFAAYYKPFANHYYVTAPHSHMLYMELVIEFGLFGAVSFFAYFISVMKNAFSSVGQASSEMKTIISATVGSLIGMLFVFGVEYVWFYSRDMFVYFAVVGILCASSRTAKILK